VTRFWNRIEILVSIVLIHNDGMVGVMKSERSGGDLDSLALMGF